MRIDASEKGNMAVVAVAVLVLGIVAYAALAPAQAPQNSREEKLKIGVVLPLTGFTAYLGESARLGIEIAKEEINSGGVRIEVVYGDSKNKASEAVKAARKLVEADGVDAMQVFLTQPVYGVAPYAQKERVPTFGMTLTTSPVEGKSYVFRDVWTSREAVNSLFDYYFRSKHSGERKELAMLLPKSALGREMEVVIKELAPKYGVEVVAVEKYKVGSKDYKTQLTKIKQSEPDTLFMIPFSKPLNMIRKQMVELDMKTPTLMPYAYDDPLKNIEKLHGVTDEVVTVTGKIDFENLTPQQERLKQKIVERGSKLERKTFLWTALYYDQVQILYKAFQECEGDKECMKEEIEDLRHDGVAGDVKFEGSNIGHRELTVKEFTEEGWETVRSPSLD